MYDHVIGEVVGKQPARLVLRAGGVGYELAVPTRTAEAVHEGEQTCLKTILHVSDGVPMLIGFATETERTLARRCLKVPGVGPSICLAILSLYSPREVAAAVQRRDAAALRRVKGVGAKTAERLVLELRDHVADLGVAAGDAMGRTVTLQPRRHEDAVAALLTLGFAEKEARTKVSRAAAADPDASTEVLIRAVLRG